MNLTEALKYATKPKASVADYHRAFDKVAGDHTGSFDSKAQLPVEFYGDHLRSEGHHPQADFVDSALQGAKELGEPAVVKVDTTKFPEKHREQFEAMEPGDFYLHLDRPQGSETHAVLFQKSHTEPDTAYGFLDSIQGTPDEVKAEVERFRQAGVPVDLGRTVDPQSEDYDLWQRHFGLHKEGEVEPDFGTEEPEQYAANPKSTQPPLTAVVADPLADHKWLTEQRDQYPEGSPAWEALETARWNSDRLDRDRYADKASLFDEKDNDLNAAHSRRHYLIERLASAAHYSADNGDPEGYQAAIKAIQSLGGELSGPSEGEQAEFHPHYYDTNESVFTGDPVKVLRQPVVYKGLLAAKGKAEPVVNKHTSMEVSLKYINESHSDFHNKILENPKDTTTPLVYADWLQEQGKEHHAALIRDSIANARASNPSLANMVHSSNPIVSHLNHIPSANKSYVVLRMRTPEGKRELNWYSDWMEPHQAEALHKSLGEEGAKLWDQGVEVPADKDPQGIHPTYGEPADPVSEHFSVAEALKYINETHADFHNRILENPAETTPALAYADWLQENGKPAHAELIRTHVEQSGTAANHHYPRQVPYVYGNELSYHPHEIQVGLTPSSKPDGESYISLEAGQKDPSHSLWWDAYLPPEQAEDLHNRIKAEGAPVQDESHTSLPTGWKRREGGLEPEEAVSEHFTAADKPLRYSAVPDHEIHPDYAPNGVAPRVGHLLGQLAQEDTDAGTLAEGILRTGSHDILPILADRLDETEHPLAQEIDWRHTPRAIRIDRALHREIGKRQVRHPDGHRVPLSPGWVLADMEEGIRRPAMSKRKALLFARIAQPDATSEDVAHSLFRLLYDRATKEEPSMGTVIPDYQRELTKARLQRLGHRPADPFRYTDLRAEGERKYAAWKAPAGGMVVKQSPLAVSGQWAEGGEFVNDLQKLPDGKPDPVEYKKERQRKKQLVVEYLKKRFKTTKVRSGTPTAEDTATEE